MRCLDRSCSRSPASSGPEVTSPPLIQRQCACGGSAGPGGECEECQKKKLQRKALTSGGTRLRLGSPNDPAEHEADRMAEAVVRAWPSLARRGHGTSPAPAAPTISDSADVLRRQAGPGEPEIEEEEPETQTGGYDESGQPKHEPGTTPVSSARLDLPRSGGRPIDRSLQAPLQQSFGHDFGNVRVHTGDQAAAAARQVSARAFTVGSNVYFGRGHYRPGSQDGLRLLAHELTHVVQQAPRSGGKPLIQRQSSPGALGALRESRPLGIQRKTNRESCDGECPGSSNQPLWTPLPVKDDDGEETLGGNEQCPASGAATPSNFIRRLNVRRVAHRTDLEWGPPDFKKPATKVETIKCSPNRTVTPTDNDLIGAKCTACHTNKEAQGMGWFTGFQKTYLRIGFHNSQLVDDNEDSSGCVRVSCAHAEMINKNTATGVSKITVDQPQIQGPKGSPSKSSAGRPTKAAFKYKIQGGDTVEVLAKRFGVSEKSIVEANKLENPNEIFEGHTLIIPEEGK